MQIGTKEALLKRKRFFGAVKNFQWDDEVYIRIINKVSLKLKENILKEMREKGSIMIPKPL